MSQSEITPELLQAHAGFIRSLARGLLSDEALVDDVVQETYIKALTNGPRHKAALSSWLRTVTRNLSFKALRSQGRRSAREEASARAERLPATIDLVERRQSLDHLVGAVKSLPDHYQEVVMLRFFEDLPPRVIAKQLDLPVNTVRMRLHRALKCLRQDLDQEYNSESEWRSSLAILAGLPMSKLTGSPEPSVGLGWSAGAIGSVAVLAIFGVALRIEGSSNPIDGMEALAPLALDKDSVLLADLVGEDLAKREYLNGTSGSFGATFSTEAPAAALIPSELQLRVVSEDGEPVSDAEILTDWDKQGLVVRGRTDAEGQLDLSLPDPVRERLSAPKSWRITACARANGQLPSAVMSMPADINGRHEIVLRGPGANLVGMVTDSNGAPVPDASIELGHSMRLGRGYLGAQLRLWKGYSGRLKINFIYMPEYGLLHLAYSGGRGYLGRQVITETGMLTRMPPAPTTVTDSTGGFRLAGTEVGQQRLVVRAPGRAPRFDTVNILANETTTHNVKLGIPTSLGGTLERVDGMPLQHAMVYAVGEDPIQRYASRVNAAGRYHFKDLDPGVYTVFAESGPKHMPEVAASSKILLRKGKRQHWKPALDRSQALQGQIVGQGAMASGGWVLQLALAANPSMVIAETHSRPDGSFSFPAAPPYECILEVRNNVAMNTLPIVKMRGIVGGQSDLMVELPRGAGRLSPLVGRLLDTEGEPTPPGTQVMVIPTNMVGRSTVLLVNDDEGGFTTGPLLAGVYFVMVPGGNTAYVFEEPWIAGSNSERRDWKLKPRGKLQVEAPVGVSNTRAVISQVLALRNEELLIQVFQGVVDLPTEIQAGPGTYRVEFPDLPLTSGGDDWSQDLVVE